MQTQAKQSQKALNETTADDGKTIPISEIEAASAYCNKSNLRILADLVWANYQKPDTAIFSY